MDSFGHPTKNITSLSQIVASLFPLPVLLHRTPLLLSLSFLHYFPISCPKATIGLSFHLFQRLCKKYSLFIVLTSRLSRRIGRHTTFLIQSDTSACRTIQYTKSTQFHSLFFFFSGGVIGPSKSLGWAQFLYPNCSFRAKRLFLFIHRL